MNPFSKTNLPLTFVVGLIMWAWVSFLSGAGGCCLGVYEVSAPLSFCRALASTWRTRSAEMP